MLRRVLTSSVLALSLLAGTTAQAAPARVPTPVSADSEMLEGDNTIWLIGGALVAIVLLILLLDDGDDIDLPESP